MPARLHRVAAARSRASLLVTASPALVRLATDRVVVENNAFGKKDEKPPQIYSIYGVAVFAGLNTGKGMKKVTD